MIVTVLRFATFVGVIALFGGPLVADVPDPSTASRSVPGADKAEAPSIIKPGTRIIFFATNASIPGLREKMVLSADGSTFVGEKSGRAANHDVAGGTGGYGYAVARVTHLDRKVAAIAISNYMMNPSTKVSSFAGGSGLVSNAGSAADFWINPDVLKATKNQEQTDGLTITRMPYTMQNKKYDAIRFTYDRKLGQDVKVYDLASGMQLFAATTDLDPKGKAWIGTGEDRRPVDTGLTYNSTLTLVEVKDQDVPWKGQPVPQWVEQFKELKYEGVITTAVQGVNPSQSSIAISVVPKAREDGWLRYGTTTSIQHYRLPPQTSTQESASGHASVGGLWIAPQALAGLKVGQVIDVNEVTKTKTVVAAAQQGYVTFSEVGQIHRIDISYDLRSGVMAGVTHLSQNQLATTTTQVRLTGQR